MLPPPYPWRRPGNNRRQRSTRLDNLATAGLRDTVWALPVEIEQTRHAAETLAGELERSDGLRADRVASASYLHADDQPARRKVVAAMETIGGTHGRVARYLACGSNAWVVQHCGTRGYALRADLCHDRWCPYCSRIKAREIGNHIEAMAEGKRTLLITLTLRHTDRELGKQLTHLMSSFNRLRRLPVWRQSIVGGAWVVEVKVAKDGIHWHPHIHVIAEGSYIPKARLVEAWRDVTGGSYIVDISRVSMGDKQARYACKYATKGWDQSVLASAPHLRRAIVALRGRRLVATFGSWRWLRLSRRAPGPTPWVMVMPLAHAMIAAQQGHDLCVLIMADVDARAAPDDVEHGRIPDG